MSVTDKPLHVAAVQMASRPGAVSKNLGSAAVAVAKAVDAGAALVLLPELMATGYRIAPDIWETAEPIGGRITTWLLDTAMRYRIHLGTTLLEANGADFYNTFLLATPEGKIAGTFRKTDPAWIEARYYRGHAGPHVIETSIGRIGVGICYENYLGKHVRARAASSIDLLLQPTAAATPPVDWPIGQRGADAFDTMLKTLAQRRALMLGVPVIMSNLCGTLVSPLPGRLGSLRTTFPGASSIVDGSGKIVAMLASEEGTIDATVLLGRRSAEALALPQGQWSVPMPWYAPVWPVAQDLSARRYERDPARKAAASRRSGLQYRLGKRHIQA
ncbi:MAG TPA: carbon-nitrogen hydrolase family protein [Sphingomonas sp.]|uniref:carbon-nitrogen hydrolase family protein n=1 Tax=Sphingomonas sp. TaxID=28214 RepID=UPI002ED8ED2B